MIFDYLRRAGRWTLLLVLLPVLCAGTAFWLNRNPPPVWSSSATILSPPTATARTGSQYVNDLQAALLSDAVVAQVAKETKTSSSTISSGLTSAVLAPGSTLLQVRFTASDKSHAAAVPGAAARAALQSLLSPIVAANLTQLKVAEDQESRAVRDRDAYAQQTGVLLPALAYQSGLGEVAQLRANAVTAHAEGRLGAAQLDAALKSREAAVAALAPQVVHHQDLQAAVDSTYQNLNQVRATVGISQAEATSLASPGTIKSAGVVEQSNTTQLLQRVLAGAVVGVIFAVLILAGLVTLSRRRSSKRGHDPGADAPAQSPSPFSRSGASNTDRTDSAQVASDSTR